jgi:carboxypeptidase T
MMITGPRVKAVVLAGLVCLGAGPASPMVRTDAERTRIVSVAKDSLPEAAVFALDLDVLTEWAGKLYVVAGTHETELFERAGIGYAPEATLFPGRPGGSGQGGANGAYHSHAELETDLIGLERKYPTLAKVFDIGESLEKRPIYALKISDNVAFEEEEAEVLFLGCHHAREWISIEVPLLLGRYLLENYATDPAVRKIVDSSEIWIVPLVNPDGLEYSIHAYRYWRKNRRDNGQGYYGVDLNRNYGYKWGFDNLGSSPSPAAADYRGKAAFSEPETQAVRDLFLRKDFRALVSYHSFSQTIMYPWGYSASAVADKDALLRDIGAEMARRIRSVNDRSYEVGASGTLLYVTNGDLTDWAYATSAIPAYTIELPPIDELGGGFFNRTEDIDPIFKENLPAMLYLIETAVLAYKPPVPAGLDLGSLFSIKD